MIVSGAVLDVLALLVVNDVIVSVHLVVGGGFCCQLLLLVVVAVELVCLLLLLFPDGLWQVFQSLYPWVVAPSGWEPGFLFQSVPQGAPQCPCCRGA